MKKNLTTLMKKVSRIFLEEIHKIILTKMSLPKKLRKLEFQNLNKIILTVLSCLSLKITPKNNKRNFLWFHWWWK
jgi:hypothetical protein